MKTLKAANGKQASIHVVERDGQFKVFDAQSRYRAGFPTRERADAYAAQLAGVNTRQDNNRPFAQMEK